jgi:hypothetical protein
LCLFVKSGDWPKVGGERFSRVVMNSYVLW